MFYEALERVVAAAVALLDCPGPGLDRAVATHLAGLGNNPAVGVRVRVPR